METTHPRASEYLFRDCLNVCRFFSGAGAAQIPAPELLFTEVTDGGTISPEEALDYQQTIQNASKGRIKRSQEPTDDLSNVCLGITRGNARFVLAVDPDLGVSDDSDDGADSDIDDGAGDRVHIAAASTAGHAAVKSFIESEFTSRVDYASWLSAQ